MEIQQRINAFSKLGDQMRKLAQGDSPGHGSDVLERAEALNGWFTSENLRFALKNWADQLELDNLVNWLKHYPNGPAGQVRTVGVVMAGNIPMVGFHDFLSVLMSGHKVIARVSSKDSVLLPYLAAELLKIEPAFEPFIQITEEQLKDFDAIIATGSNNTARYFEHYFGKYPHLIRKNRNSVAVLSGSEDQQELLGLAEDVFRYYGLGCRNVSKVFVPKEYSFDPIFEALYNWKEVINQSKYINNYDYNKAVYLMGNTALLDNEFILLKEDQGLSSPIGVLFYEYYDSEKELDQKLLNHQDDIQVVVAADRPGSIPFGSTQRPALTDYADGIDSLHFLHSLN